MNHITQAQAEALAHRRATKYTHRSAPNYSSYAFVPRTLMDFVRDIEAAAIQAHIDAQKASGWQDISTAPQENQRVLVWYESGRLELTSFWHGEFISSSSSQPTHWMPLPAAPVAPAQPSERPVYGKPGTRDVDVAKAMQQWDDAQNAPANVNELVEALKAALYSLQVPCVSCQKGIVSVCKCRKCVIDRGDTALANAKRDAKAAKQLTPEQIAQVLSKLEAIAGYDQTSVSRVMCSHVAYEAISIMNGAQKS